MERLNSIWQDLRFAVRGIKKDRGFALLAIFALALGIGATTVIFSVIENVLIEPFPYRYADRLALAYVHDLSKPTDDGSSFYTVPQFLDIREQNHVFEEVLGVTPLDILYQDKEGTQQFTGASVTANAFEFLGMKPLLGRNIVPGDGNPGAPPVFSMSYRLWKKEFNGDPRLVGSTLLLNGEARTLVGVMPPRFLLWNADVWVPLVLNRSDPALQQMPLWTLGRMKPGVTLRQVVSDFEVITKGLAKQYPAEYPTKFSVVAKTLTDSVVGHFRGTLYTLLAAVAMLLLIACSNVANLLLARATAREREIAIRASMGASRGRLVRQLLVESFVLASGGCLLGCLFAYGGLKGVTAAMPPQTIPAEAVLRLNIPAMLFAVALLS